eukprot:11108220-Alexandrium_andersonii.AAC.1
MTRQTFNIGVWTRQTPAAHGTVTGVLMDAYRQIAIAEHPRARTASARQLAALVGGPPPIA